MPDVTLRSKNRDEWKRGPLPSVVCFHWRRVGAQERHKEWSQVPGLGGEQEPEHERDPEVFYTGD